MLQNEFTESPRGLHKKKPSKHQGAEGHPNLEQIVGPVRKIPVILALKKI